MSFPQSPCLQPAGTGLGGNPAPFISILLDSFRLWRSRNDNLSKVIYETRHYSNYYQGRCDEKALPATPYSLTTWPASLSPKYTEGEMYSHVYHNEILSLCRGFSSFLPDILCNIWVYYSEI